jgi:uncharacterized protein (DUF927 family)
MVEFVERGMVIDMTIYTDHLKETVMGTTITYKKSSLDDDDTMKTIVGNIVRECSISSEDTAFVQEQISFITGYYEDPTDDPSVYRGCMIPAPYLMTQDGVMIHKPSKDDPDNHEVLTSTPLSISAMGKNVDNGDQWYEVYIKTLEGGEYAGWKKQGDLLSKPGITDLMNKGLASIESNIKDINAYLLALMANNAQELPRQIMASNYGWKNNYTQFIIGDVAISMDRTDRCMMDERDGEGHVKTTSGNISEWVRGVSPVLNADLARFKCYAMCAAPIIELIGNHSFLVEHVGTSGSGKTTTALIARSMFTNPKLLDPTSTSRGIEKVGAKYGSIGLIFDETRSVADFQKAVYNMINVNSRATSDKEQNLRESKRANTVIMTTSESSLLHDNAYEGIQARVLTLTDRLPDMPEAVPVAEKAVKTNYGFIGPLFIRKVMKYMNILIPRYNKFLNTIPDSDVTQAGRRKAHFALMAVAGNILEDVFKDIGIEYPELEGIIAPKKASAVCTKYFMEAVHENAFESQDIQALRLCYDHVTINPKAFYVENCTDSGTTTELLMGCDRDVMGWTSEHRLDFHKGALANFLNEHNQVNLKQLGKIWKTKGILNPGSDEGRVTIHVLKCGKGDKNTRVPVISFNRKAVENILGISDTDVAMSKDVSSSEMYRAIKEDIQTYCDCTLDRDVHTSDIMEIATRVFNDNGDYYERQGIKLDDIILAIGDMRLV